MRFKPFICILNKIVLFMFIFLCFIKYCRVYCPIIFRGCVVVQIGACEGAFSCYLPNPTIQTSLFTSIVWFTFVLLSLYTCNEEIFLQFANKDIYGVNNMCDRTSRFYVSVMRQGFTDANELILWRTHTCFTNL